MKPILNQAQLRGWQHQHESDDHFTDGNTSTNVGWKALNFAHASRIQATYCSDPSAFPSAPS